MADTKASALVELTGTPADDDQLYIIDTSATTAGSKRYTWASLRGTLNTLFRTSGLKPTGALGETIPRYSAGSNSSTLSTGRLTMVGIRLEPCTVTAISFLSGGTAAGTPTNWWFALYDSSLNLLRQTADQTTTAWGTNTLKTVNLTSPYVVTTAGLYYLGVMVTATTVPTLRGAGLAASVSAIPPIMVASSTTGLTTTAPNPAAALAATGDVPYSFVT